MTEPIQETCFVNNNYGSIDRMKRFSHEAMATTFELLIVHEDERRKRLEAMSAKHRALLDRRTALDDMEKVLRKRGMDEAADKLSLEDVPDEGEELDQMRELLT